MFGPELGLLLALGFPPGLSGFLRPPKTMAEPWLLMKDG